jgi:epoxyqueuosine reductase
LKILMHCCCAPCSIYPIGYLRNEGAEVMGFFYRHNIHPWTECQRREETLRAYAETIALPVIYQKGYDIETFLRNAAFREANRCHSCYHDRLKTTALLAKRGQFDYFTSSLLYSKFQQHEVIKAMGEAIGNSLGIPFYYRDFREGWKEGVNTSKQLNLYRQPYCGCIYSEKERFYKVS